MFEYNEDPKTRMGLKPTLFKAICERTFNDNQDSTLIEQLSKGASNATFKFVHKKENYVLRIYVRDPSHFEVESGVMQLVSKVISIPELICSDCLGGTVPFAVFRFVEGKHLFELTDVSLKYQISYELGRTLAKIHGIGFERAGLFGSNLEIKCPFLPGSSPYYQYIKDHLVADSLAWIRMGDALAERVLAFIDTYRSYFPVMSQEGVLVHSDFKPVNLLWNRNAVTVLDWEFAHSGSGMIDFAILLRHFQEFPLDLKALEKGYSDNGGVLSNEWLKRARITDFINIVQLTNAPADRPNLYKALSRSLQMTMNSWENLERVISNPKKA